MKKLLAAIVVATPMLAHSAFLTGERLLALMNSGAINVNSAAAYINGVADTADNVVACIPARTTVREIYNKVRDKLNEAPEQHNLPADAFVLTVLMEQYPCRNGKHV